MLCIVGFWKRGEVLLSDRGGWVVVLDQLTYAGRRENLKRWGRNPPRASTLIHLLEMAIFLPSFLASRPQIGIRKAGGTLGIQRRYRLR